MKVLLVNGSPHKKGCTYTALNIVKESLGKEAGLKQPEKEKRISTNFIH